MRKMLGVVLVPILFLGVPITLDAAESSIDMPAGVHVKEITTDGGSMEVLADANGMTLYTFDMDVEPGRSVCTGQCARFWPALAAGEDAEDMGPWTVITRPDDSRIWAYHGKPLYTFTKDRSTEDFRGNGLPQDNPVWRFAVPMSEPAHS